MPLVPVAGLVNGLAAALAAGLVFGLVSGLVGHEGQLYASRETACPVVSLARVTRPAPSRLQACLLAAAAVAGSVLLSPAVSVAADTSGTRTPLTVTIDTLAPSAIPRRGRVTLTGRITNRSQETWTALQAYLLTSPTPITSRAALDAAARTPADAQVGVRQAGAGLYQTVGDLAPGQSVRYRVSVRRKDLGISGQPGVYWVGVHVLGGTSGLRDSVADGRARTFMPLLPARGAAGAQRARTRMALLVPLREPVHRGAAGRLLGTPGWTAALGPDGRLDRLLRLSGQARGALTWVVDPALLDAVQSVAQDNPRLDLSPSGAPTGGPSSSPSENASGGPSGASDGSSPSTGSSPGPDGTVVGPVIGRSATAVRARRWLGEFRRQAPAHTVATVPYGDLDVASVLRSRLGSLYQRAVALSTQTLSGYGVTSVIPVVDPLNGSLPDEAVRRVDTQTPVVLGEAALPGAHAPLVVQDGRPPVVLTDASAGAGGPKPNPPYDALAVRQRLLSDAALHALSSDRGRPLAVSMPARWDPGAGWGRSRFFAGLRKPWLAMVDLQSVVATAPNGAGPGPGPLDYPQSDRAAEVPAANLRATLQLVRTGGVFGNLLTATNTVDDVLADAAMLGSSSNASADPARARSETTSTTDHARFQMAQVRIEGPPFVRRSRAPPVHPPWPPPPAGPGRPPSWSPRRPEVRAPGRAVASRAGPPRAGPGRPPRTSSGARAVVWGPRAGPARRPAGVVWAPHPPRHRGAGGAGGGGPRAPAAPAWAGGAPPPPAPGGPPPRWCPGTPPSRPAGGGRGSRPSMADGTDASILSSSAVMAAGTVVSRASGLVRNALLAAALGQAARRRVQHREHDPEHALHPAGRRRVQRRPGPAAGAGDEVDPDGGEAYTNRVITLAALFLAGVTVAAGGRRPVVMRLFLDGSFVTPGAGRAAPVGHRLRALLPAAGLLLRHVRAGRAGAQRPRPLRADDVGADRQQRHLGRGARCVPGLLGLGPATVAEKAGGGFSRGTEELLLGLGSTLGIAVQLLILVPFLRRAGFTFRPRFDFRGTGLGHTLRLGVWTVLFVVVNQVAYTVVVKIASAGSGTVAPPAGAGPARATPSTPTRSC